MRVVHLETQVVSVLGRLDDDDNVTETYQATAKLTSLSGEAWSEQARLVREKRDELVAEA